jgi:hypothetical protein
MMTCLQVLKTLKTLSHPEPEGADGDEDARGEEEREGSPIPSEDF